MEVSDVLKKAWAAVEEAGVPPAVQEAAFREAVRLYASPLAPAVVAPQAGKPGGAGGSTGGGANGDGDKTTVSESTIYERVSSQTGVGRDLLEQLVHLDDGVIRISLSGMKLGRNNADKTRVIAKVLTVVRGFGLEEHDTSVEHIRSEAQRLKCYDGPNFAAQLKGLNGFVITGAANSKRIRAKSPGLQEFPSLVDRLLGES